MAGHGAGAAGTGAATADEVQADDAGYGFAWHEHAAGQEGDADLFGVDGLGDVGHLAGRPVASAGIHDPGGFIAFIGAGFVEHVDELFRIACCGDGQGRIESQAAGDVFIHEQGIDFFFQGFAEGNGIHQDDGRIFDALVDSRAVDGKGAVAKDHMGRAVIEALLARSLGFGQFHDALARFLDEIIGKFSSSALQGVFFDAGSVDFPQGVGKCWHFLHPF